MPTWSQPHSGAIAHRAWCDPRPRPRGLRAWGSGVGPCPRPSLALPSAVEPQVPAGPGLPVRAGGCGSLWRPTTRLQGEMGFGKGDLPWGWSVVPCVATPGPAGGQKMPVSWQPSEKTPLGAWERQVSHLAGPDGALEGEGQEAPGSGGNMLKAGPGQRQSQAGLQEAMDPVDGACSTHTAAPVWPAALGRGTPWAVCPASAQWEGLGGSEPVLSHGCGRIQLLGGHGHCGQ